MALTVGNITSLGSSAVSAAGAGIGIPLGADIPGLKEMNDAIKNPGPKLIEAAIKKTQAKLPAEASAIKDSVTNVTKNILPADVKGIGSTIFHTILEQLMQGIPSGGSSNPSFASIRLHDEAMKLLLLGPNKEAYKAQFNFIAVNFPLVDVNNMIMVMLSAISKGTNPLEHVPNLQKRLGQPATASGSGKKNANLLNQLAGMLLGGLMGGNAPTPTKQAVPVKKTPKAKKPQKAVQIKNLATDDNAQSMMGAMNMPLSQLMSGLGVTVPPVLGMLNALASPNISIQKLSSLANTANWGSDPYPRDTGFDQQIEQQFGFLDQLEQLSIELAPLTDIAILTTMTHSQLLSKYPAITALTTVGQALDIINGR